MSHNSSDAGTSRSAFSPTRTLSPDDFNYHETYNKPAQVGKREVMETTGRNGAEGGMSGTVPGSTRMGSAVSASASRSRPPTNKTYNSRIDQKEDRLEDEEDIDRDCSSASDEGIEGFDKSQSTLAPFDPDSKEIRRLRRKVDRRLMPLLTIIYLCSYLDRANIGNAKVYNIERDLGISDSIFTWALSIFYFAYILGEVPSSLLLKKIGPARWISIVITLWGTVMMSMAALKNGAGLLAARFFLGLFESGYAPAPVVMIALWYTRLEQAFRIGIFFSAATVAGACAGLIAYGIARLDGVFGLKAWAWIFLIEGGVTIAVAIIAFFALPDLPETSSFLTEREKKLTTERLRYDAGPATQTHFSWKQFRMVYKDPKTYLYTLVITLHHPAFSSLGLFVPSIVRGFNFDPVTTQLMTVPIWAVACIATLLCALSSDRLMGRGSHAAVCVASSVLGYVLLIVIPEEKLLGRYVSLMLCVSGAYACLPILLAWPASNVGGHTKRNVTIATVISLSQVGSAVGGKIYRDDDAPRYIRGHSICAGLLTMELVVILFLRWYLLRLNAKRRAMSTQEYQRACQGEDLCDYHPDFRFVA